MSRKHPPKSVVSTPFFCYNFLFFQSNVSFFQANVSFFSTFRRKKKPSDSKIMSRSAFSLTFFWSRHTYFFLNPPKKNTTPTKYNTPPKKMLSRFYSEGIKKKVIDIIFFIYCRRFFCEGVSIIIHIFAAGGHPKIHD